MRSASWWKRPIASVLDPDPVTPARTVATVEALGDDALEAVLERPGMQVVAVCGVGRRVRVRAVQFERVEQLAPFVVAQRLDVPTVDRQHIEDDVHDRDRVVAVKNAPAKARLVGTTLLVKRDELAVENETAWHVAKLREQRRPAACATPRASCSG
jgi:hypothetical protein